MVGAAAVLYKDGQGEKLLRYALGSIVRHMTFEGEAAGLRLALELVGKERKIASASVKLDIQAVLQALTAHKAKSRHAVIHQIHMREAHHGGPTSSTTVETGMGIWTRRDHRGWNWCEPAEACKSRRKLVI